MDYHQLSEVCSNEHATVDLATLRVTIMKMDASSSSTAVESEANKKSFTHVRVLHNFIGANNDELCMKKDDVS